MIKKLLTIFAILIGSSVLAFDTPDENFDINTITGGDRFQYVQGVKAYTFSKDCAFKLETDEFKKMIKEHKKDNNYPENYYAAQSGYTSFKGNNLSAMFTPKMDIMYLYAVQPQNNVRTTFYYNAIGHLKYIDFSYGNYPNYPYYARKYTKSGKLINTLYCPDEMTQIKFNKDGSTAEIWYKGKVIEKIKEL